MRFTQEDIKLLKEWGERDEDIEQIKRASKSNILVLKLHWCNGSSNKIITQKQALKLLGREGFLSGLCRASFHWTCSRTSLKGNCIVSFDCSKLFKEW